MIFFVCISVISVAIFPLLFRFIHLGPLRLFLDKSGKNLTFLTLPDFLDKLGKNSSILFLFKKPALDTTDLFYII